MDQVEFNARMDRLVKAEIAASKGVATWFYLSYAGDEGFRGGCYVRAFGPTCAAGLAAALKISPGGEVRIFPIPSDCEDRLPPSEMRHRLLSLAEMQTFAPMVEWDTGEEPR